MKKGKLILFQLLSNYLLPIFFGTGIVTTAYGQQVVPVVLEKTVTTHQAAVVNSKIQQQNNKSAVIIWGAGSQDTASIALGQFANSFSSGTLSSTQWSAISINEADGVTTPGNAYWVRNTTGYSQGAYWSNPTPHGSASQANGSALFDSDYLDNGGTPWAFGTGSSPSSHRGELISPRIDLTGYSNTAISINFFTYYRNLIITDFSVGFSVDDGLTYTDVNIRNLANDLIGTNATALFNNVTAGVANLSQCRIRFVFEGEYYFTFIDDVSISASCGAINASINATNISCFGANDGSVTASVSAGTAPYSYLWSNGANTASTSSLAAGLYTVTATDANGCTGIDTVTIAEPNSLNAIRTQATMVSCFGGNDGSVSISTSGGTAPYAYIWTTGDTAASLTNQVAGLYNVTVTDANGCTSVNNGAITHPSALTNTVTSNNISCNGVNNGSASVSVSGGTAPYSYLWSDGANSASTSNMPAGNYTITVRDANGCLAVNSVTITAPAPLVATKSATDVSCNGANDGTITATTTGGTTPYTYQWFGNTGGQTTATVTNLGPGSYDVLITDANGCSTSFGDTIMQPTALIASKSATDVSCNGGSDGTITASTSGGTAPYTYQWFGNTGGQTTATVTNLSAGSYDVIVTDANGCSTSFSDTIMQPTALTNTVTSVNTTCNGINNGSASVSVSGGTAPYSYLWSDGANSASTSNMPAGNYTITVSDANGCLAVNSVTITAPAPLVVTKSATDVSCNGANDGTITATTTGGTSPYTYQWIGSTGGQTTATVTNLGPGSYDVIVTDANGCATGFRDTIVQPIALTTAITSSDVSCNGGADGSASATVSGGTAPYSYLWSNGANSASTSNMTAGNYTITVSDANGCASTSTATITAPTALTAAITSTDVSCNGGANGSASVSVSGGTAPYTYLWSDGANSASTSNLAAGTYTIAVSDANGCTLSSSASITEPTAIDTSISWINNTNLSSNQNGASYQWLDCNNNFAALPNETNQSFNAVSNGSYAVEITLIGCVDTSACQAVIGVGIENIEVNTPSLELYPNPNNGVFTIVLNNSNANNELVQIFDLSGSLIRQTSMNSAKVKIDLSELADGLYFLRYKDHAIKFIVNK